MKKRPKAEHVLCKVVKEFLACPANVYSGGRRIVFGFSFWLDEVPIVTLKELGYTKAKITQLNRNYWNPVDAERVKRILSHKRSFNSASLMLRGTEKESRSMGWCMNNLILTRTQDKKVIATFQYRSSELIRKFGGDLIFIPILFERMGVYPDRILFQFANSYIAGIPYTYMGGLWPGGMVKFLEYLRRADEKFFWESVRYLARIARRKDQVFPYRSTNASHQFGWKNLDMDKVREYLKRKYEENGKEIPKDYHPLPKLK